MSSSRRAFLSRLAVALGVAALPPELVSPPAGVLPIVPSGIDDEPFWEAVRKEFLTPPDESYFNTGSLGSQPRVVVDAATADMVRVARDLAHWNYQEEQPRYQTGYAPELALRRKLASLIAADADDVGLTINSTMAMNFIANGLDLDPGDEVVALEGGHPGGRAGWELREKRDGIRLVSVSLPQPLSKQSELIEMYEAATTPRTRVWALPHLTAGMGNILFPAEEMCRRARQQGIVSVVDGAQTLGQRVIDVHAMGCDAFFSSPHKWLLAPVGCGVLYIRREARDRFWTTLAGVQWDNHSDGMYRFMQYGAASGSLLAGLEAAMDFHISIGPERIERRVLALTRRLRDGLQNIDGVTIHSPQHPEMLTAMTTWGLHGMPGFELQESLWSEAKVRVRAASHGVPAVRQCCHINTTMREVERSLDATRALAARG